MVSRRAFLAGAAGLAALAGCGTQGTAFDRMRSSGVARIGIAGERPYGFLGTDGSVTGEGPSVARAVLADLGIPDVEAFQVPFAGLLDGLVAGQFDLVAAGTTVTPSRCARVAFSRPDFLAPLAFLVEEGNPIGLRTLGGAARSRTRLGVLSGSAEEEYALAAGVSPTALTGYDVPSLYALKGEVVRRGMKAITGLDMPVFPKRRFQHGAASADAMRQRLGFSERDCRQRFERMYA